MVPGCSCRYCQKMCLVWGREQERSVLPTNETLGESAFLPPQRGRFQGSSSQVPQFEEAASAPETVAAPLRNHVLPIFSLSCPQACRGASCQGTTPFAHRWHAAHREGNPAWSSSKKERKRSPWSICSKFPCGLKQCISVPLSSNGHRMACSPGPKDNIAMRTRSFRWLVFQDTKALSLTSPLLYPSGALEWGGVHLGIQGITACTKRPPWVTGPVKAFSQGHHRILLGPGRQVTKSLWLP